MTLALEDGRVILGGKTIFEDVQLSLEKGHAIALIGPNGAGKTSVLRAMAGLLELSAGAVICDGKNLNKMSVAERATKFSFVGQLQPVAFEFSALEFVLMALARGRSRFALESSSDVEKGRAVLAELGVLHVANQPLHTLSSGESQRVRMAQALLAGTQYWLLDEPTSNLDLQHQVAFLGMVKGFTRSFKEKSGGVSGGVLAVMHDLNAIRDVFDEVVVMAAGRVVARGTPAEVLVPDVLSPVFGVKLKVLEDGADFALVTRS